MEILNFSMIVMTKDSSLETFIKAIENSDFYKEFSDTLFLTQTSPDSQGETCFAVLAILSYQVEKRPDLVYKYNTSILKY